MTAPRKKGLVIKAKVGKDKPLLFKGLSQIKEKSGSLEYVLHKISETSRELFQRFKETIR